MSGSRPVPEGSVLTSSSTSSASVLATLANAHAAERLDSDARGRTHRFFEKLLANIQLHLARILPQEHRKIVADFSVVQSASVSSRASSASAESEEASVADADESYMAIASQHFTTQTFDLILRLIKHMMMLSVPVGDIDRQKLLFMSSDMQNSIQHITGVLQQTAADCIIKQRAVLSRLQIEMIEPVLPIPDEHSERLSFLRKFMDEITEQDQAYISGHPKQAGWSDPEFAQCHLVTYDANAPLALAQYTIIRATVLHHVLSFLQAFVREYQQVAVQVPSEADAEYAKQHHAMIESMHDRLESIVLILTQTLTQAHVAEVMALHASTSTPARRHGLGRVAHDSIETAQSIFHLCKEIVIFANSQVAHIDKDRISGFEELVEMSYDFAFQLLQQSRMVIARAEGMVTGVFFGGMGHTSDAHLVQDLHRLLELNVHIQYQKAHIQNIQRMIQDSLVRLQEAPTDLEERAKFTALQDSAQLAAVASQFAETQVTTVGDMQEKIIRDYFQLLLPMSGVHALCDAEQTNRFIDSLVAQIKRVFREVEILSEKLQRSNDYARFLTKMDICTEQRKIVALISTLEKLTEQVNAIKDALHNNTDIQIVIQEFSTIFGCVRLQLGQLAVPVTVRAAIAEDLSTLSPIFDVLVFKEAVEKMQRIDLSCEQRLQIADTCHQNIRLAHGLLLGISSKMGHYLESASPAEVESRLAGASRAANASPSSTASVARPHNLQRPASATAILERQGKRRHPSQSSPLAQFSVAAANANSSQRPSNQTVGGDNHSTGQPALKSAKLN
jgi:hypothetical protein